MGAWGIKALERDEGLDVLDILKNEYRINFMDVFLCFIRMSVLQLGQNNTQMVAHIMPQDRQSLAADLYLFNFVLHGLKLHFTKIAVLRYLLFISYS